MLIDIHTHVYPDELADRVVPSLAAKAGINPAGNGKLTGLFRNMEEDKVDMSVILPVVTKPLQYDDINRIAFETNREALLEAEKAGEKYPRVLSFAGIHPDCDRLTERVYELKKQGFVGIKVHPDFQNTYFDDPKFLEIVSAAEACDMITIVHAGYDDGLHVTPHCAPEVSRHVIDLLHPKKLVLAHIGGYRDWDNVEKYLVGTDCYMDLAISMHLIPPTQLKRIIEKHGVDKFIFGTDWPWTRTRDCIGYLEALNLSEEDYEAICYKNALRLLGM